MTRWPVFLRLLFIEGFSVSNSMLTLLNEHLLKYFDASVVRRSWLNGTSAPAGLAFPAETWAMVELPSGLYLWIDLGDSGVSLGCLAGTYEGDETAFILDTVKEGQTFVDIGANIGWFAVQAARKVGATGRVIAIEPRAQTGSYLARSLLANQFADRSEVHHCAVGTEAGRFSIAWDGKAGNPGGTWSLPDKKMAQEFRERGHRVEEVEVKTLDSIVGDRKVHLIKIDIEGAEGLALRGAARTLAQSKPVILSEMNFSLLLKISGISAGDYVRWMAEQGYRCHALEAGKAGGVLHADNLPGHMVFVNVIFVPVH